MDPNTMSRREILPPSLADLEALANDALRTIPAVLRQHVRDVIIQVQEFPDEETEAIEDETSEPGHAVLRMRRSGPLQ